VEDQSKNITFEKGVKDALLWLFCFYLFPC
jgi:hypothetical protein